MYRRLGWIALAAVVGIALFVGTRPPEAPPTSTERADALAERIRCPTCRGQSVADSDAPASEFIREEIARQVEQGQSDQEIEDYLVSRYGDDVLLVPPRSGLASLVWVLPVVALVGAGAGLVVVFRRWGRAWVET